ncbi:DUF2335 domain-containing protein [Agarivorans sp. B2Z047]|uniref:DUF2335 domain-containing protein n=1 Tax=Agarivorans sp. B2Z047 TaxID=2652721 RepID=UPI00128CC613|nr:DUF2335 domain-containing protein [Agarivorans sp. B2Z047]MPW31928.1 DUF2335 domain-containing protein [Agarivorans sp. B2Z047]UQN41898.1 DUF2335 domain-containing protein [Agarivorans sp. B2Z047]
MKNKKTKKGSDRETEDLSIKEALEGIDNPVIEQLADKPEQLIEITALLTRHERYSSPLPPPEILESLERLSPGSVERIIDMAEKDAEHEREMEREQLAAKSRETILGQVFALIIGLATLGTSALITYMGHPGWGGVIGSGGLVALVSAFIIGRKG